MDRTENTWHVFIEGLKPGQLYGYKIDGEYNPGEGKRFNAAKLLIDPYAKAITHEIKNIDHLIFAYEVNNEQKDLAIDNRDNTQIMPKSIVIDDRFDWGNDTFPNIPMEELIIYEVHLKGFTAHPSSGVKHKGTYLGFIEKIPYLKELGINAVEFLPVHQFFIRNELIEKKLTDYWGYNTIAFLAPHLSYSTLESFDAPVKEFKTLVKELHRAGIEVILDVIYNHTGEGNHLGPTLSLKGIDNSNYYTLTANPENDKEPYRFYKNDTGCGNMVNAENLSALQLILDSLRYWRNEMHVDGFRFDLATVLTRVKGEFSSEASFFKAISQDPVLQSVKLIAEPWDLITYQIGNFAKGWSEWNGKFRDTLRKFNKGDNGQIKEVAARLTGSDDLFQKNDRNPYNSINFMTCHDGFCLNDLYSYNTKHNEANLEDNKDGPDDNISWNCGVEGQSDDPQIELLRKRLIKNAFCYLLFSAGTPMILYGDEIRRTQKGNNNAYCQDNELTWFNWDHINQHADILDFVKKAISIRKYYPLFERTQFSAKDKDGNEALNVTWFGPDLNPPAWDDPLAKILSCQLVFKRENDPVDYHLFVIMNPSPDLEEIMLPQLSKKWHCLLNTAQDKDNGISPLGNEALLDDQAKFNSAGRSFVILLGR